MPTIRTREMTQSECDKLAREILAEVASAPKIESEPPEEPKAPGLIIDNPKPKRGQPALTKTGLILLWEGLYYAVDEKAECMTEEGCKQYFRERNYTHFKFGPHGISRKLRKELSVDEIKED